MLSGVNLPEMSGFTEVLSEEGRENKKAV